MRWVSKPVLNWRATFRSFVGTWRMWVIVIALVSAFAGMMMGQWHKPSQGESHPLESTADQQLSELVGAKRRAALEAPTSASRRHMESSSLRSGGDPGSHVCPTADSIIARLVVTLSADRSFVIASNMHVSATGVTPAHPPLDLTRRLHRPQGATLFASCFIVTENALKSINWSDGKLEADIDLKWNDNPSGLLATPITSSTSTSDCNRSIYF